jgi:GrpB-like predicted nucleotidyltransferase (UPF0157 family)
VAHHETLTLVPDLEAACLAAQTTFEGMKRTLIEMLPSSAEVLHVGATAIPGCLTKGDLDIVIRVRQADFERVDGILAKCLTRNAGSVRTQEFSAFEDLGQALHVGVQLVARDGSFDIFHSFVDALRANPELVRRYNALKLAFHGKSMVDYRQAKNAFITEALRS